MTSSNKNPLEFHFLLSDLKSCNDNELSYFIELMRATEHIKGFRKLIMLQMEIASDSKDEDLFFAEADNMHTLMLNLMGGELREAIKLFNNFRKTELYNRLYGDVSNSDRKNLEYLNGLCDDYDQKKGLLYSILIPHRNKVFHYSVDDALKWVSEIKESEKERKPFIQSVCPENFDFYIGAEYDKYIYSRSFFINPENVESVSILEGQNEVFQCQDSFINFVKSLTEFVLKENDIQPGRFGMPIHRYPRGKDLD